jgi:hypothetical protein
MSAVENKSAEQKAQMASYVDQLNKLYPELNLQYSNSHEASSHTVADERERQAKNS